MKFFLFIYLLIFPFGQLARLPVYFLGPEVRVYLGDVLVGLAVGVWGIWKVKKVKRVKRGNEGDEGNRERISRPILVFAGVAAWSLLVNLPRLTYNEALVASFYLLRWIVYVGIYFVVSDVEKRKATAKSLKLLDLLILVGGIATIIGLLQYLHFPDLRTWLEARHWDPHYYRVYGIFFDPGYFGMIMVLTLILLVTRSHFRITYHLSLITCYLALALTYSRSSYLAYLVGMGVIAWKLKKPKFYAAVLLIFTITLILLPRPGGEGVRLEREASIKARIINWKQSLTIAKDHLIFGVGFNAYRYAQRDYGFLQEDWRFSHAGAGADSSLLFVLATTGVAGLIPYLWLLKRMLHETRDTCLTGRQARHKAIFTRDLTITASIWALLTHSLFLNSLFYPWIMAWMWILLGTRNKFR